MKICHISTVHQFNDDRILFKECNSLSNAGFEVCYVVQHSTDEIINGVKIISLPYNTSRVNRILFAPIAALRKALKQKADVYHFHDPELIFLGGVLKLLGKKVIYDVHEDYPKQILYKNWISLSWVKKIIATVFNFFEKAISSSFDAVITATDDIAANFKKHKVAVIKNFAITSLIDNVPPTSLPKTKFTIIYAGGISKVRGIYEVIESLKFVKTPVEFWLLGEWETDEYRNECEKSEGYKHVKYLGKVPMNEVYGYVKQADLGIALLYPIKNYLTSLPVKVFEYMACNKAVIMSDFDYWKTMFGANAKFVNPYEPQKIATEIDNLISNQNELKQLGDEGYRLCKQQFSWEAEEKKLIEIYQQILKITIP